MRPGVLAVNVKGRDRQRAKAGEAEAVWLLVDRTWSAASDSLRYGQTPCPAPDLRSPMTEARDARLADDMISAEVASSPKEPARAAAWALYQ
jgi:hypothetical protein